MSEAALEANLLCKRYVQGEQKIDVLDELSFAVGSHEKLAIVGRSGSGKSTLLHVLAGLDTPDSGSVLVAGSDLVKSNNDQRARMRGQYMGFVYQNHHLLPEFSALENVAMPLRIGGKGSKQALQTARLLLEGVGLAQRADHLPSMLSGGERQRVAVVRAIAGSPSVVLADEPTGNLDVDNAHVVMRLLADLASERGTACIVVTHDTSMLGYFDRVLTLEKGKLRHYAV